MVGLSVNRPADRQAGFFIECENGITMTLLQLRELELWAMVEAS